MLNFDWKREHVLQLQRDCTPIRANYGQSRILGNLLAISASDSTTSHHDEYKSEPFAKSSSGCTPPSSRVADALIGLDITTPEQTDRALDTLFLLVRFAT